MSLIMQEGKSSVFNLLLNIGIDGDSVTASGTVPYARNSNRKRAVDACCVPRSGLHQVQPVVISQISSGRLGHKYILLLFLFNRYSLCLQNDNDGKHSGLAVDQVTLLHRAGCYGYRDHRIAAKHTGRSSQW